LQHTFILIDFIFQFLVFLNYVNMLAAPFQPLLYVNLRVPQERGVETKKTTEFLKEINVI